MTEQELRKQITALRRGAEALSEPEKGKKLTDAELLEMQLEGMGLDQAADIMSGIKTTDLKNLDAKITAAKDATKAERVRTQLITDAIKMMKRFLGLP